MLKITKENLARECMEREFPQQTLFCPQKEIEEFVRLSQTQKLLLETSGFCSFFGKLGVAKILSQ